MPTTTCWASCASKAGSGRRPYTLAFVALKLLFPLLSTERLRARPKQQYSRWAGWALTALGATSVATAMLSTVGAGTLFT